jgi:predicted nucleic acid-binding protein
MAAHTSVIALDTNLLVYAHRAGLPQSRRARRALQQAAQQPRGWGFADFTVAEFWSVVTHPSATGGPSRPEQARDFLANLALAGARILAPGEHFGERLIHTAADLNIHGPRIFDLAIALTAFDNGATEIWTHDSQFVSIAGLRVFDPL